MISRVSELHFNFPALFQEVRQIQFQDFPGNQIGGGGGEGRAETVDNVGENVVTSLFVLNVLIQLRPTTSLWAKY